MKKIHFFKAYSRLGLINPPHGSQQFNYGVEIAPDFVLDQDFLKKFVNYKIDRYTFSKPEKIIKEDYQKIMAKESLEFAALINEKLKNQEIQVVIGGDHSVAFGSVLALLERYKPEELTYVHFDSHADTSSMQNSPSQNFHGQFLRALIDENFDHKALRKIKGKCLLAKNTVIIGDLEADDFDFIEQAKINYFDGHNTELIIERIKSLSQETKHLHISFDIDVFEKKLVAATGTPNSWGGLNENQVLPILEQLALLQNISMDLVEVNPKKTDSRNTINLAQEILSKILLR